ncbi:hypothetical protein ACIOKD_31020 [Streptomyces sp. NPDC087844]|uniref:hypothetical protein n=1 Tax=Streptomyces sp. NPDC087844 TaxID=3365805 RepID=UPI00380B0253
MRPAPRQRTARRQRAEALGDELGPDKPTVTVLRYLTGMIRLCAKTSFIFIGLHRPSSSFIGLHRPILRDVATRARRTSRSTTAWRVAEIDPTRIDEADADRTLTGVSGDAEKTDRASTEGNPLRKRLDAIERVQAEDVPEETRYLALGVTAASE